MPPSSPAAEPLQVCSNLFLRAPLSPLCFKTSLRQLYLCDCRPRCRPRSTVNSDFTLSHHPLFCRCPELQKYMRRGRTHVDICSRFAVKYASPFLICTATGSLLTWEDADCAQGSLFPWKYCRSGSLIQCTGPRWTCNLGNCLSCLSQSTAR